MELFVGAVIAFLVEVLVIAGFVAPRWTGRMLTRPVRAARSAPRVSPRHPHMAQSAGR